MATGRATAPRHLIVTSFGTQHRFALLAAVILGLPCTASDARAAGPDELVPVNVKGIDSMRRRADVNWATYDAVLVAPVTVSFSKLWDPRDYGRFGLRPRDVERIRSKVATLAQATFVKVLAEGGYRIVDRADAGVLQVEPNIIDLYVNAPDLPQSTSNATNGYDITAAYTAELALVTDPTALVKRLNLLLCAGQMSAANQTLIVTALNATAVTAGSTDNAKRDRVAAAVLLVMASSEYLIQK